MVHNYCNLCMVVSETEVGKQQRRCRQYEEVILQITSIGVLSFQYNNNNKANTQTENIHDFS